MSTSLIRQDEAGGQKKLKVAIRGRRVALVSVYWKEGNYGFLCCTVENKSAVPEKRCREHVATAAAPSH